MPHRPEALPGAREARRRQRRDAILAAASRSFLEHGYAATSMSAIAATLGGSKGTLWRYFPSKQALFAAVMEQRTAAYRAHLSSLLVPSGALRATLHGFCAGLIAKITSADAVGLYRLVVAEAGRFPEMGRSFYEHGPMATHALLSDFLAGAMVRGLIHRGDPRVAARLLVTLCTAGCHQRVLTGMIPAATPAMIEADAELAVAVFLDAFAAEGPAAARAKADPALAHEAARASRHGGG